jgi:hypothetical protein
MSPQAKEVARLSNEILSVGRRLRNLAKRLNSEHALNQEILKRGLREIDDRRF